MHILPPISNASVKVMRSYDYCHFEVVLGCVGSNTTEEIDLLRKAAARLADKAVEQYKIAKADAEHRDNSINTLESGYKKEWYEAALATPEGERTPTQKAEIKAWRDAQFHANRDPYDYQDDWRDEDEDA